MNINEPNLNPVTPTLPIDKLPAVRCRYCMFLPIMCINEEKNIV